MHSLDRSRDQSWSHGSLNCGHKIGTTLLLPLLATVSQSEQWNTPCMIDSDLNYTSHTFAELIKEAVVEETNFHVSVLAVHSCHQHPTAEAQRSEHQPYNLIWSLTSVQGHSSLSYQNQSCVSALPPSSWC